MAAARPRQLVASTPEELEAKIRDRVLRLLTAQPRTRAELERSLSRAGAPDDVVARVLDRYSELRLVDDEAYAEAYVRTGLNVRRRGARSLSLELRGRGVDPETIAAATAQIDTDAEYETAKDLAVRRARSLTRFEPAVRRRRLTGLLLRRGFPAGVVSRIVEEVLSAPDDPEDDGAGAGESDDADW